MNDKKLEWIYRYYRLIVEQSFNFRMNKKRPTWISIKDFIHDAWSFLKPGIENAELIKTHQWQSHH